MSRSIFAPLFACTVLFLAVSFPAQAQEDLVRPEGWQVRFDNPEASEDQLEMFVSMPPGWHVTSGPAAIYWGPDMEASGEYRIEMEVYLFDPAGRLEAFGIFVGGQDLMGDAIEYTYFLLRDGGEFIVKRREGPEAPTIHAWTGHDAILGWADREEEAATVKNVLALEAGAETVRFFVNDAEVAALPRADLGMDGVFGMRVNHALNLHISRLETVAMGGEEEEVGDQGEGDDQAEEHDQDEGADHGEGHDGGEGHDEAEGDDEAEGADHGEGHDEGEEDDQKEGDDQEEESDQDDG